MSDSRKGWLILSKVPNAPDPDRAEQLLRQFAKDLSDGLNPSDRMLTQPLGGWQGENRWTWEEGNWVYEEVGHIILQQLDED